LEEEVQRGGVDFGLIVRIGQVCLERCQQLVAQSSSPF
jgi:hypothetical protein